MRERCINEFNVAYGMDSKLKGKNRDITPFERKSIMKKLKDLNKKYLILKMKYLI